MTEQTETPLNATPLAQKGESFSLRAKLIIAFGLVGFVPLVFIAIHSVSAYSSLFDSMSAQLTDPDAIALFRQQSDDVLRGIIMFGTIFALFIGVGIMLADRFLVAPLKTLSQWLHAAHDSKFIDVAPLPINSVDEIGALGLEIDQSIKYFQEVEARERQIAEEKGEFISVAAHQLRTPLTGLKWTLETLREPKTSESDRVKLIEQVSGTTDRMVRLVDDVLDVAKIEEGKFGYDYVQVDLVETLQKLLHDFMVVGESRGVSLVFEHEEKSLPVYMDINRIALAVSNLLSNAIDYTAKGGSVALRIKRMGRQVEVSVHDTGIGISPEDQKRLFTKFYRGENARHMRPDGSGLGLYIVRNVALRHGGDMSVESALGKGSTFSFKIPLEQADLGKSEVTVGKFFASL